MRVGMENNRVIRQIEGAILGGMGPGLKKRTRFSQKLIYNTAWCHTFPVLTALLPHGVMVAQVTLNHFV